MEDILLIIFHTYNNILEVDYIINKTDLLWLTVLEMQGIGASPQNHLLVSKALREEMRKRQ